MAIEHPSSCELSFRSRAGLRTRHTGRLFREVLRYSAEQRLWWLVPVVVAVLVVAAAITTTTGAVPVAVYTLF